MNNLEYTISNLMILLTVVLIPFALKSKNRKFSLAAILLPLIANVALYIIYDQQPSFGYLALVGAVSVLMIRKNPKNTDSDTSATDETILQEEQKDKSANQ